MMLEDRRGAVRALKSLSREYQVQNLYAATAGVTVRHPSSDCSSSSSSLFQHPSQVEVGSQAMHLLIEVLKNDRADTEITNYALETLINVTSPQDTVRYFGLNASPLGFFLFLTLYSHPLSIAAGPRCTSRQ